MRMVCVYVMYVRYVRTYVVCACVRCGCYVTLCVYVCYVCAFCRYVMYACVVMCVRVV